MVVRRQISHIPEIEITVKGLQILDNETICLWPQSTNRLYQRPILLLAASEANAVNDHQAAVRVKS
ncbi:hypothetical protein [Aristophania vespae]|uniref:hypothetical protein n=1 Tax=Aristophania vespae TaxID=2697033 RepID=UPI0023519EFF|nr:hypothetical protein [Aristophania vespae]UMM64744.1 hypothetical protein DM15PD_17630 [Aristophania vespae]